MKSFQIFRRHLKDKLANKKRPSDIEGVPQLLNENQYPPIAEPGKRVRQLFHGRQERTIPGLETRRIAKRRAGNGKQRTRLALKEKHPADAYDWNLAVDCNPVTGTPTRHRPAGEPSRSPGYRVILPVNGREGLSVQPVTSPRCSHTPSGFHHISSYHMQ